MTQDTRERLLEAAERLFARNGYAGTSLREITAAAGANIAAVNYHFGTKEGLLAAVLDRVVGELNRERIVLLDASQAASAPAHPSLEAVLTAFLLPDLHAIETLRARDPQLPRFVSRMYSESSDLMTDLMGRQFAEVRQRFSIAFADALPELDLEEIAWRLQLVVGIVVYLFAGVDLPGSPPIVADSETTLARLLTVTVPLMTAPAREVTALRS
jgi:AcrR family transcriptional regulator